MDKMIRFFALMVFLSLPCLLSARSIYVVSVGISNYQNITSLRLPQEDAKAVTTLYKEYTRHISILTGRYATRQAILAECRNMYSKAGRDDMIVFFFSGHGFQGGLCPYDMHADGLNGIYYSDLQEVMRFSKAACKVIVADACFAGGLRVKGRGGRVTRNDDSNVLLFLSSREGETSQEKIYMRNGVFTHYLVEGLRGAADSDYDRKVSAKELFTFVSRNVRQKTRDMQHPVMWGNFDDSFIFLHR